MLLSWQRNKQVRKIFPLILVIFSTPMILCAVGSREEGQPVHFEVIESSTQGGSSEQVNLIAKTEEDFKYIWDLTHRHIEPKPPMPSIAFGENIIACIMMGERNSSGYSVDVNRVIAYEASVVIDVLYNESGGMLTVMTKGSC